MPAPAAATSAARRAGRAKGHHERPSDQDSARQPAHVCGHVNVLVHEIGEIHHDHRNGRAEQCGRSLLGQPTPRHHEVGARSAPQPEGGTGGAGGDSPRIPRETRHVAANSGEQVEHEHTEAPEQALRDKAGDQQGESIEQQVRQVDVHEHCRDQPPPLAVHDRRRVHRAPVQHRRGRRVRRPYAGRPHRNEHDQLERNQRECDDGRLASGERIVRIEIRFVQCHRRRGYRCWLRMSPLAVTATPPHVHLASECSPICRKTLTVPGEHTIKQPYPGSP